MGDNTNNVPSEEIYTRVFENAHVGLLLLDTATGSILKANHAIARITGRPIDELIGRIFWEPPLVADAAAGAEIREHLQSAGTQGVAELPLQISDGTYRVVEIYGSSTGSQTLIEARDVTAHDLELRADRMETLRRSALRASVEFQKLHRTLRTIGELLVAAAGQARSAVRELEEVQQATERAGAIAGQLAAFSGAAPIDPRPIALNNLLQSMQPRLRQIFTRDTEIVYDLSPDLETVMADPSHLRQILLKLAANSRDAMGLAGTFCVQTRNEFESGNPSVILAVSDNGSGFDDQSWAHLFEPFSNANPNGTGLGLGLAAVHGMVRSGGGRLWAFSQPGQGATIRIYLPLARSYFPALPLTRSDLPAPARTILIVEPSDRMRTLMANVLKRAGYRVLSALHSEEALRTVESQGRPDLLIAHPDPDLANQIAGTQPNLKMLCLVGYAEDIRARSSRVAFLRNPFDPETLLTAVRDLLSE